jgi:type II secretory pathway component PulK
VININTAPAEVLTALKTAVTPRDAEEIVAFRQDQPFKQLADLGQVLQSNSDAYSALMTQGIVQIGVKSNFFRITATAQVGEGVRTAQGARTAIAVVNADGSKVHYLKVE